MDKQNLLEHEEQNIQYDNYEEYKDKHTTLPNHQNGIMSSQSTNNVVTTDQIIPIDFQSIQAVSSDLSNQQYAGYAWLSILCCCFPLSIPAVFYSDKAHKAFQNGDMYGAKRNSFLAKKLSVLAIIFGLFFICFFLFLFVSLKYKLLH